MPAERQHAWEEVAAAPGDDAEADEDRRAVHERRPGELVQLRPRRYLDELADRLGVLALRILDEVQRARPEHVAQERDEARQAEHPPASSAEHAAQ